MTTFKRAMVIGVPVLVLLAGLVACIPFLAKKPDAVVVLATAGEIDREKQQEIVTGLKSYLPDFNRDGAVVLDIRAIRLTAGSAEEFSRLLEPDETVLLITDEEAFAALPAQTELVRLEDIYAGTAGVKGPQFRLDPKAIAENLPDGLNVSMKAFTAIRERDSEEVSGYYKNQCDFMDNIVLNRKVM
ncbi:hypothetical protein [Candidatus Soleaferrea massiliensis]|uniref:hypothetical protein n=1 Tax=Candidatus Soleaferrea massiliensis TaxID=1470354 RepID=UPI00058F3564|nr:hypothetical protein [Candidatus Soleaferrea massiliensis]